MLWWHVLHLTFLFSSFLLWSHFISFRAFLFEVSSLISFFSRVNLLIVLCMWKKNIKNLLEMDVGLQSRSALPLSARHQRDDVEASTLYLRVWRLDAAAAVRLERWRPRALNWTDESGGRGPKRKPAWRRIYQRRRPSAELVVVSTICVCCWHTWMIAANGVSSRFPGWSY